MSPYRVGEDLHGDVRLVTECVQVLQLLAHDVGRAHDTAQGRLVQDDPQTQRARRVVDPVLTAQPHLQASGRLFGSERGDRFSNDGLRIGGGLQQAGDHEGLVGMDRGGVRPRPM
ncbi:hypothetical protein GCM10010271_65010 [Streptomyces kurssanovii]|nr:hypothetical protein GCM10010271_65010 [Streptomyces kurssanovii]